MIDDFGSYDSGAGFSDGDQMGFYSMRDENGNENNGYVNLPTRYVAAENCFKNEALIVDYPNNFGYTFGYFFAGCTLMYILSSPVSLATFC